MNLEKLVTELIDMARDKRSKLQRLKELSEAQQQLLLDDPEDVSELQRLIDSKQAVMGKIDAIDAEFLFKYEALKKSLGVDSLESITEEPVKGLRELKLEIQQLLQLMVDMKVLDDSNTQKARDNLDKVKAQLKVINVGRKATSSYSNSKYKQSQSILIDNKR